MESLHGFEQKAWNFFNCFSWSGYRHCRQKGKSKMYIIPQSKYMWNNMVLKDAFQHSVHTMVHVVKSPKTLRREKRGTGDRQVTCLSFQPAVLYIHLGTCSFPSVIPESWKNQQVCSEQPQNDDWHLGPRMRPNTHARSIAPSRDTHTAKLNLGLARSPESQVCFGRWDFCR